MTGKKPISFRLLLTVLLVIALLIGIYLIVPKNYHIDCRLNATEMDNGSGANQKQTTLAIVGVYRQSLLGGDSFAGQSFPAYRRIFPIPPTELAVNSGLKQNPGYQ